MAKQTSYSVEVIQGSEILYYRENNLVISYVPLEQASSTTDFAELGRWDAIAESDLQGGSIDSWMNVEIELKASPADVDGDIHDATEAEALAKLTELEKAALGL